MKGKLQQDSNRSEALWKGFFQMMGLLEGPCKARGLVQRLESSKASGQAKWQSSTKSGWLHLAAAQHLLLLPLLFGLTNGKGDIIMFFCQHHVCDRIYVFNVYFGIATSILSQFQFDICISVLWHTLFECVSNPSTKGEHFILAVHWR